MTAPKTVGIICECNPFHGGHAYLIRRARESGADVIICVMSGCFTQRGEAAAADPLLRAEAVIRGGADLVLELPFPYASSGAEIFARAGVDILSRVGVDGLWFGSECGDLERLQTAARICDTPEFAARYAASAVENRGTAQAYFEILNELVGADLPLSSNDILAVSYLRAIASLGSTVKPVTVRREGSAFRDCRLSHSSYPSASALRALWRREGTAAILPYLPEACREVYATAQAPAELSHAERLILGHFRLTSPASLEGIAELSGGLGSRLSQAAMYSRSMEELLAQAATKKYPQARLQRGILFALTGVTPPDQRTPAAYTRLLAANKRGREYLAAHRKTVRIDVVTRKTELPIGSAAERQAELELRAWSLWTLCHPDAETADRLWKRAPRMVDGGTGRRAED